jgi:dihydrofolate reductase
MEMEMIVALNQDGIIGINNKVPWYIPEDLQRFKKITEGHIVIMGRKTYESLPPNHRPLKNRLNIVLSRQTNIYDFENDNLIFTTMDNIYDIIKENIFIEEGEGEEDDKIKIKKKVFIIGGSEIYNLFINQCSIIHITKVIFNIDDAGYDDNNDIAYFPNFIDYDNKDDKDDFLISKNKNIKYRYITYKK